MQVPPSARPSPAPVPTADATPRRSKRSRHVALVLAGTAVMALAACEDDKVDAQAFPDVESCIAAAERDGLWLSLIHI